MKNAALSRALKWLFAAQLLSIVAMLPVAYALKSLLQVAAGLLALAALVLSILSYFFTRFLIPLIFGVAAARWGGLDSSRAAVLLMTMQMGSFFLSVVLLILGLLVLLLVCLTTAGLVDDPAVAARGSWAWKVNLICTVAVLVLTMAAFALSVVRLDMEKLLGLSTAITLLSAVIQLAARVLYLRFLWKSARCLSAAGG